MKTVKASIDNTNGKPLPGNKASMKYKTVIRIGEGEES